MHIEFDHQRRIVSVWLASDGADSDLLDPLYRQYRSTPYRVAVFRSGRANLTDCTSALLRHNR